jgi:hypothetical protein
MATNLSGPAKRQACSAMNSYNRTKKGNGRQTMDRSAGLDGKSRSGISIATLKKEVRCRIDIDALSLGLFRQSQTGFAGEKNSPIRTLVFKAVAALTKPSRFESDVPAASCSHGLLSATDSQP